MAKYARITLRRDSTLNWYAANPRLALGEVGVDMNLLRFKVGNGIDKWNELPYMNDDLYKDLDNATRELAEKIASILETVKNNKSDADKKISILDGRMTGLESRQSSYENNLTSQFAKVEKALNDGLSDFAETKKSLVARMDVIVGSATEDTEILDARVDALDVAHPNLGHNIRSLHNKILENETASNEKIKNLREELYSEFLSSDKDLQAEINKNSEAVLQNSLNIVQEADQRRKSIETETQARKSEDEYLQAKINDVNNVLASESLQRDETDKRLQSEINSNGVKISEVDKKIESEISERLQDSVGLAIQTESNAQANLQNNFNLLDEIQRRKQADDEIKSSLAVESREREEADNRLSDNFSNAINREKSEREASDDEIKSSLAVESREREKADKTLEQKIENEINERINSDVGLAQQAEANATANLENLFRIIYVEQKNKSLLELEASARFAGDYELQTQIDSTAEAGIQNALNIHNEAEQRRRDFSAANERIDTLNSEIEVEKQTRSEQDEKLNEGLQSEIKDREKQSNEILGKIDNEISEINTSVSGLAQQAESNANANIENTLNILEFDKKRKADLGREEATRIIEDESLQKQINTNSHAIFETVINLKYEAEQRRKVAERLIQEVKNREHEIENILYELQTLYKITLPGFDEDFHSLQVQENQNAEANIQNSLNILDEAQRREKLKSDIEKSINQEVQARNSEDLGLAKQINMLAFASNQNTLTLENINKQRKTDDEIERYIRIEQDDGLQLQINTLAQALFELILKENYTSKKIDAIEIAASEESTNFASDEVVNDLINDILNS